MANATRTGRLAGPVVAALALISALTTTTGVSAKTPNKNALAGTWLETVWFPAETGRPPLKSLSSYHRDGTSTCSDRSITVTAAWGALPKTIGPSKNATRDPSGDTRNDHAAAVL